MNFNHPFIAFGDKLVAADTTGRMEKFISLAISCRANELGVSGEDICGAIGCGGVDGVELIHEFAGHLLASGVTPEEFDAGCVYGEAILACARAVLASRRGLS